MYLIYDYISNILCSCLIRQKEIIKNEEESSSVKFLNKNKLFSKNKSHLKDCNECNYTMDIFKTINLNKPNSYITLSTSFSSTYNNNIKNFQIKDY